MKNHLLTIFFLSAFLTNSFGQANDPKYNRYFSKDQLSFTLNSSQWIQSKKEVKLSPLSRGCNIQMMYPILGKKSNVAFAIGFGAAFQNYYLDQFISTSNDSVHFTPIPDSLSMRSYKLNTNYLTLPIELRFRTNPTGVSRLSTKFYLGCRLSYLINSKTKYVGTDPDTGDKVKEKMFYINHIPQFDYGVSLRIGRGRFLAHGYYSLSSLFETTSYPKTVPIEVGFSLILF